MSFTIPPFLFRHGTFSQLAVLFAGIASVKLVPKQSIPKAVATALLHWAQTWGQHSQSRFFVPELYDLSFAAIFFFFIFKISVLICSQYMNCNDCTISKELLTLFWGNSSQCNGCITKCLCVVFGCILQFFLIIITNSAQSGTTLKLDWAGKIIWICICKDACRCCTTPMTKYSDTHKKYTLK